MLAKATELGSADGILVCRKLGGIDDGLSRHEHGTIRGDAGTRAGDVDAGADAAGGGERLGMDWMTRRSATVPFWTSAEKAAQVIDGERLSPLAGRGHARWGGEVLIARPAAICATGGDGNALVDDGDTCSRSRFSAVSTRCSTVCIRGRRSSCTCGRVLITATHRQAYHGDGPDVEVLLLNHAAGFRDSAGVIAILAL